MGGLDRKGTRLNKYLAACGICSRREADRLIEGGEVSVNGQRATLGTCVMPGDSVKVGDRQIEAPAENAVLAFYKPVGVTCTEKDAHADRIIADYVDYKFRVTYAGRLDRESEGLLLLTNDGDLIRAMMQEGHHEKEYLVQIDREVTPGFLQKMEQGIYLKDLKRSTLPCRAEQVGKYSFRIVLTQGLNRQIRRMCKACGANVKTLKRVRVINIGLGELQPGQWREVSPEEKEELYRLSGLRG